MKSPERSARSKLARHTLRYIETYWRHFAGATLDDFDQDVRLAYGQSLNEEKGMYISGGVGTGKTHLLIGIFKDLAERGDHVAAWQYTEILEDLKADFDRAGTGRALARPYYENLPVLLIDDIGSGRPTRWTAEVLFHLLDSRMKKGLRTYYTSNHSLAELGEILSECYDGQTPGVIRDGDRIASRIRGTSIGLRLTGPDRRGL